MLGWLRRRWLLYRMSLIHECRPFCNDLIAETAACSICGRDMTGEI